jgi:hypothetical protein
LHKSIRRQIRAFPVGASFAFTVKISAKREAPDVATFDESIAEGAMDEEKVATDGCLAAGRKLTGKVNEAPVGSDFSQSAYDHKDMSLCEKLKPTGKSSNLALEATYATPSVF